MEYSAAIVISVTVNDVFATNPYDSGYDHGCSDAGISNPDDWYINQDGKGPEDHTDEFMNGYHNGFDTCSGNVQQQQPDQAQSQVQTSNNENNNENTNSLSQSQATTIYICKENGCTAQ